MSITAAEMTNLYLYGSPVQPSNLTSEALIRSDVAGASTMVNVNDYMTNGPGRFASPAFFEIVKQFFSSTSSGIPVGSYTENQLASLLGINQRIITQQQWAYDDGSADYAERVYIWNTVAFEIDDGARFVVEADGTRHIDNFAIIPFTSSGSENF